MLLDSINSINNELILHSSSSASSFESVKSKFDENHKNQINSENIIKISREKDAKDLEDSIKQANVILAEQQTDLKFVKHEKLNEYYIQIIDLNNNVIQEIPNKKELDFFAAFMEFNQLIDKKI